LSRRYVGESVPRREDAPLLTGKGRYLENLCPPGVAYAMVVRSPFAHARIERLNLAPAAALPGVVAVLGASDLMMEWAAPLPMIWPITEGMHIPSHWPLTADRARFAGDGVAVVVATSPARARDAVESVEVDYEPLPHVIDSEVALMPETPLVHPEFGTNRCYHLSYALGDMEQAFAQSNVRVSRRLVIPRLLPSPMEPRGAIGEPTGSGEFVLTTSSQVPHIVKRTLGVTLGIPEHRLRVIAPDVGGAFGAKLNVYAEEALVLALARRLQRPVKWVEDRSESAVATTHGRGQIQYMELAARRDGSILGIRARVIASMGAYLQLESPGIPALGKFLFGGAYRSPAYSFDCTGVFTNQTPSGAYRGVGRAEALYAVERMMDVLAAELDLDPAEVRRINFLPAGEGVINAGGIPYDSVDYEKPFNRAIEISGYSRLRSEQAARRSHGGAPLLGIGLCSYVDSCGVGPSPIMALSNYQAGAWESARVRVLSSGTVEVASGTSSQGQGHQTVWAQIAADALEVPMEDVVVVQSDTALVPPGTGTFNSRSLVVGGSAVHLAATRVLGKAKRIAAHLLEVADEDVRLADGSFTPVGAPDRAVSWAEVARAAYFAHNLPSGLEPGLEDTLLYDPPDFTYPFGTHVAVVEVDPETGEVAIIRYVAVDDCGHVVNPLVVEGQVHGGIAQGLGQALFEEARYSSDGQLETSSLMSYLVPGLMEMPTLDVDRTVTTSPNNPLGAKGAAESGIIAAAPAVMNAVVDALRPLGVLDVDLPATPERVWRALRQATREAAG
jgi:aerobic carbon-monoxide dehydrogenase large subunit